MTLTVSLCVRHEGFFGSRPFPRVSFDEDIMVLIRHQKHRSFCQPAMMVCAFENLTARERITLSKGLRFWAAIITHSPRLYRVILRRFRFGEKR